MSYLINGIQQIGIGIPNANEAWHWYSGMFGMDIPIFREAAEAPLMTPYTGGEVQARDAILAINIKGGSGFEIWQYTSRNTVFPEKPPIVGDTGIYAVIIKCESIQSTHRYFLHKGCNVLGDLADGPDGQLTFFLKDPWGNIFQIIQSEEWFQKKGHLTGGPVGAVIGVSSMEKSLLLYRDTLGFDVVDYDEEGFFPDWSPLNGGGGRFRRMRLSRDQQSTGPFGPILGSCSIELVQSLDRQPDKIFQNRYWGDGGFIHLCFDVHGMDALGEKLSSNGLAFTVDSNTPFDMGEAAGRFTYIEDNDGTLIEFVETWKVPVMKKWGWYINLSRRPYGKPLPRLILKALGLGRVKSGKFPI